jgi:hypothetical protein
MKLPPDSNTKTLLRNDDQLRRLDQEISTWTPLLPRDQNATKHTLSGILSVSAADPLAGFSEPKS